MFKLSKLIVSVMVTAWLNCPLTVKAEEHPLIGVNYPPLPEKIEKIGGWLIEEPYSIDRAAVEGKELLLLSRITGRDRQSNPYFQVVNVLTLPPINSETEQISSGPLCHVDGQKDLNVIVIVKLEDGNTEFLTKVRKAWRVEGEEFKEMDVAGIQFECENFGYGM